VWLDPGITPCVKTLEAIVGAQQKNRSHSLAPLSSETAFARFAETSVVGASIV